MASITDKLENAKKKIEGGEREKACQELTELINHADNFSDKFSPEAIEIFKSDIKMVRANTKIMPDKAVERINELISSMEIEDGDGSKFKYERGDDADVTVNSDSLATAGNTGHLEDEIERLQEQLMHLEGRVDNLE